MVTIAGALARNWTQYMVPPILPSGPKWNLQVNAFHGIGCADGRFRASSPENMYSLVQAQSEQGSFADGFLPQVWPCAQWQFDAAERYEGSWRNISISFPTLLANSPNDPITPLSSAYEVSAGFKDSRVVVHEAHGVSLPADWGMEICWLIVDSTA